MDKGGVKMEMFSCKLEEIKENKELLNDKINY
jgi:hypothetical protein